MTAWNKGKRGYVVKPESRIRKWFENLDQRIPREKEKWFNLSKRHKGKNHTFIWNQNIIKGMARSPNMEERNFKISKSLTGRIISAQWAQNISQGNMGHIPWNKGKKTGPLSPEHRKLIGIANSKPKPPFSEKHIENIRNAMLGAANVRRGAKHTPQTIEAIKAARALQILPMRDSKPERMMQIALSLNGIKFEKHKMIKNGKGFYHQTDMFIEPNICIEVDGDYIHGHPEKYGPEDILKKGKKAKEIWARDNIVNHELNKLGYNVVRIWERDVISNAQENVENIMKLIQQLRQELQ